MKKLFTLLMLTMSLVAWGAVGTEFSVGDCKFKVTAEPASSSAYGQATCIGLSTAGEAKSSLSLTIPYIVTNGSSKYYVKVVAEKAFYQKTNIKNVRLMYGIQDIGQQAFSTCTAMTSVRLPSTIIYIRSSSFAVCNSIVEVYYTGDASSIVTDCQAFPQSNTRTLYLPYGTDDATLRKNSTFGQLSFPIIKHSSLAYDFSMTDGTMFVISKPSASTSTPHECTVVGFASTASQVTNGRYCPSASTYPSALDRTCRYTSIGDSAFCGNTALKELDLSNATYIERLGRYAVANCTNLTQINLGKVKNISAYALRGCVSLISLNIPASTTSISVNSFIDGCTALSELTVASANPGFSAYTNALYNKAQTTLYRVPEGHLYVDKTFPATLKSINEFAFYNLKLIKYINFPYGLETIGQYAFCGCSSLHSVFIPSSLKTLGTNIFVRCTSLKDLYVNFETAPKINSKTLFEGVDLKSLRIHTPLDIGRYDYLWSDYYTRNGWPEKSDFGGVNVNNVVARDYSDNNIDYTITSTTPQWVNGFHYDGTAKVVRSAAYENVEGETNIPAHIQINGKKYAVTLIDNYAFGTSKVFSITGCSRVERVNTDAFANTYIRSIELPYVTVIDQSSFQNCSKLLSVKWGNRLKKIESKAFDGCTNLAQDVILPVGFEDLGIRAFGGTKVQKMLFPSTVNDFFAYDFNGMSCLNELIFNNTKYLDMEVPIYDFEDVPTTCEVLVPVGYIEKAKKSLRNFTNIKEGAFDFSYLGLLMTPYKYTVTSTEPIEMGDTIFQGTAKCVYSSDMKNVTSYTVKHYQDDEMCPGNPRRYLITEIGDSCFAGSKVTSIDFPRMTYLERIGKKAFYRSKLQSAQFNNTISFGADAFTGSTDLTEIVAKKDFTMDGIFFGGNAPNFTFYVPNDKLCSTINKSEFKTLYSSTQTCTMHVSSWIQPTSTTYNLATCVPLKFANSSFKAYTISSPVNSATGIIPTERVQNTTTDGGVILTDLVPGQVYKLERAFSNTSGTSTYLKSSAGRDDLYKMRNTYYWDESGKKFVDPTSSYTVEAGRCYLQMPSGASELYLDIFGNTGKTGDVNGDGTVDVADVNLTINIMLGKTNKSSYPGADVNRDNTVDIADVNAILNIMLGK